MEPYCEPRSCRVQDTRQAGRRKPCSERCIQDKIKDTRLKDIVPFSGCLSSNLVPPKYGCSTMTIGGTQLRYQDTQRKVIGPKAEVLILKGTQALSLCPKSKHIILGSELDPL